VTAPLSPPAPGDVVLVASRLFGPLSIAREDILRMPEGMLGFAGERRFVLLPAAPDGVFWLQSVDDGSLIFLLVDPFPFFPDYEANVPEMPESVAPGDVAVMSIVTLPRKPGEECTCNLQAPLVVHLPTREARQVILEDPRFHTRHPVQLRDKLR
jgi:flagellar assembly factor FliW